MMVAFNNDIIKYELFQRGVMKKSHELAASNKGMCIDCCTYMYKCASYGINVDKNISSKYYFKLHSDDYTIFLNGDYISEKYAPSIFLDNFRDLDSFAHHLLSFALNGKIGDLDSFTVSSYSIKQSFADEYRDIIMLEVTNDTVHVTYYVLKYQILCTIKNLIESTFYKNERNMCYATKLED